MVHLHYHCGVNLRRNSQNNLSSLEDKEHESLNPKLSDSNNVKLSS